jgi:hypothetical protein
VATNTFLDTNWVSMEVLRLLINKKVVADAFNTDWEKDFQKEFAVGSSIQVKFPQRFTTRNTLAYSAQGIARRATTVNLDQIIGVDFEWDDYEKAVKLERSEQEIRTQYLEPAADQLAQELDSRAAKYAYQNTSNVVGALGTDPTAIDTYLQAERLLFDLACPRGERWAIVSSSAEATFVANTTIVFNPQNDIAKQWKTGLMGQVAGLDFYRSVSLWSHTVGTVSGAITVTGGGQSGSSLAITGTAGNTLKKGDKFTINAVNQVNPVTRRYVGAPVAKTFTVTQDYTLTAGPDTIAIYPAIDGPTSQYQNVDALPLGGATITLWPGTGTPSGKTGTAGLVLSKYAFALVGAKLSTPRRVELCTQMQDPTTGLAIRFIRDFDPVRSVYINRFDMLFGFGTLYGDNCACVVATK